MAQQPVTIRLDPTLREQIAVAAAKRGISSAAWIREAIVARIAWATASELFGGSATDTDDMVELLRAFIAQRKTPRGKPGR